MLHVPLFIADALLRDNGTMVGSVELTEKGGGDLNRVIFVFFFSDGF